MKKITLFFALTLAAVGAAYSQTLTLDQFEKEKGNYQDKPVTLTNVVLKANATGNGSCASLNADQISVELSSQKKATSPSTTCFKSEKLNALKRTRNGSQKMAFKSVKVIGNEKDGYVVSDFLNGMPAR